MAIGHPTPLLSRLFISLVFCSHFFYSITTLSVKSIVFNPQNSVLLNSVFQSHSLLSLYSVSLIIVFLFICFCLRIVCRFLYWALFCVMDSRFNLCHVFCLILGIKKGRYYCFNGSTVLYGGGV